MQETRVRSLGQEDPLEKGMATHSGILAWRIPWTEEPGGLQFVELQRVGHDRVTDTEKSALQRCASFRCTTATAKRVCTFRLRPPPPPSGSVHLVLASGTLRAAHRWCVLGMTISDDRSTDITSIFESLSETWYQEGWHRPPSPFILYPRWCRVQDPATDGGEKSECAVWRVEQRRPRSLEPSLHDWLGICPWVGSCSGCSKHPPRELVTELSLSSFGTVKSWALLVSLWDMCGEGTVARAPQSRAEGPPWTQEATSCRPPQLPAMHAHRVWSPLFIATCKQIWSVRGMPSFHKTLHTR